MSHKRHKHRRTYKQSKPVAAPTNSAQTTLLQSHDREVISGQEAVSPQNSSWITGWVSPFIIVIIGFAIFFTGLKNPFMSDDILQIVDNPVVHSITHIKLLFEGGTFYNGNGISHLDGIYYRPLMSVSYSLLYTLFGPHTWPFHLLQLLLCIGNAILLYLLFKHFFNAMLSLALALIFLVHPINSQVAFAIPTLQDALFFFFGMLAMLLLFSFSSVRSLIMVAACLFLSLLSKESGVYFIGAALLYLFLFERRRLYPFFGIMALPAALWLILKVNAVGLSGHATAAPIDSLRLGVRLLTAPSIMSFYITKLIFPWRLAAGYYWMYQTFDFRHVLFPLIVDLLVVALFVFMGFEIRKRLPRSMFYAYLFFATWTAVSLIPYLQIVPLDATAAENWFYFPTVGVLGMAGLVLVAFQDRFQPSWLMIIVTLVIVVLGLRTAIRGTEWSSVYNRATHDIQASKENWGAYADLARIDALQGDYSQAKLYELHSLDIYPAAINYDALGVILANLGDYQGAMNAYASSLKYMKQTHQLDNQSYLTYENMSTLMMVYGSPASNRKFVADAIKLYPWDVKLRVCLAVLDEQSGDNNAAKADISEAMKYGNVTFFADSIMNHRPFTFNASIGIVKVP